MRKVLFLDRDGVINVDTAYLYKPEDFIWMDGIFEGLTYAKGQGYDCIVVTNQSGVARGYYGEEDVIALHNYMQNILETRGIPMLAYYYCPHHPQGVVPAYTRHCDCRKPAPGLLNEACRRFQIDRAHSLMIGDRQRDVEAAEAAGIRGVLFNEEQETIDSCIRRAIGAMLCES